MTKTPHVKSQKAGVTDQAGKSALTKDCSHSEDSWTSSKTAPKVAPAMNTRRPTLPTRRWTISRPTKVAKTYKNRMSVSPVHHGFVSGVPGKSRDNNS